MSLLFVTLVMVASLAGGRPIGVVCNVKADPGVDGYAVLETGVVHLRPVWCAALRKPVVDGHAALVLGHELGHVVLQTRDEARVECWGLRRVRLIARLLGWDPERAYGEARYLSFCGVA